MKIAQVYVGPSAAVDAPPPVTEFINAFDAGGHAALVQR